MSRKKRRDVASFGRVLEGQNGQRLLIRPLIVRDALFVCVSGALVRYEQMGGAVTFWHKAINLKDLRCSVRRLGKRSGPGLCNILAQILRKK
ncbi:hypothetical protein ACQKQA_11245 [Pseudomonas sp. NPDC089530]|uniref:hypothetical protein n=1 Tax=Pseudomonas sp. NPDC089530 TaxID=3390651 RepID=UPI003D07F024